MELSTVLAVLSFLAVFGLGWASTILIISLAFPGRSEIARRQLQEDPWRCVRTGVVAWLVVGLIGLMFAGRKGPLQLMGFVMLGVLLLLSAVGSAGFIRLLSERIQQHGSVLSPFASLTRASFLYVIAGFLPLIGWFAITPISAIVSAGAGWKAIRTGRQSRAASQPSGNGVVLDLVGAPTEYPAPAGHQPPAGPEVPGGFQAPDGFQAPGGQIVPPAAAPQSNGPGAAR